MGFLWFVMGIVGGSIVLYAGRLLRSRAPSHAGLVRAMMTPTSQVFVAVGYLVLVLTAVFTVLFLLAILVDELAN